MYSFVKNALCRMLPLLLMFSACQTKKQTHESQEVANRTVDVHSFARPAEALVKHLFLDLAVDFKTKTLSGSALWDIEVTAPIKEIVFDTRGLVVKQVLVDDKAVVYTLADSVSILGSALHVPVSFTNKHVRIEYATRPDALALQWLDPAQTAGRKQPFLFTQSQAILARTWVPCQDSPGIRFTYDARVQVPQGLLPLMSASNPQAKNDSSVYTFSQKNPISSYLLALAVGDLEFRSLGANCGVYAERVSIDTCAYEFADLQKMIGAAETLYGPYRWGRYDLLVLPPSFPFGGMENPCLTFCTPTILAGDRSLTTLVAHELAHSWSGNLATNATWNDFWLNEGFTVYFENRIMESLYGSSYSDMQKLLGMDDLKEDLADLGDSSEDTHLKLNLTGRDPDDGVTSIAYEKGNLLLRLIESKVGREKWDAFLKSYFERHAFQTVTTEQFIAEYQSELIIGDSSLAKAIDIQRWVYGPGVPDDAPTLISERFEKAKAEADRFAHGAKAKALSIKDYTTYEWMKFLNTLPEDLSAEQMTELDTAFGFSKQGNSEVLYAWLKHVVKSKYQPAYPVLEHFLVNTGRRKFCKPLYALLIETPDGKAQAQAIFAKASGNYHAITRNTVAELLAN